MTINAFPLIELIGKHLQTLMIDDFCRDMEMVRKFVYSILIGAGLTGSLLGQHNQDFSSPPQSVPIQPVSSPIYSEWFSDPASTEPLSTSPYTPITGLQEQAASGGTAGGGAAGGESGGQDAGVSAGQKAQNPIADLVSLPLQSNWNFGVDPDDSTLYVGLLQPVIPLKVNKRLNWITRPILPLINSPDGSIGRNSGLGDMHWQNFFVPAPPEGSHWMWGIGPSFVFPTASDPGLGQQLWGAGVSGVIVYTKGPVVGGFLINQNFLEAGVSQPFLWQPFFNYNFTEGILKESFISVSGEFQADWRAESGERWNNVFGIGPGRNIKVFGQPIQVSTRFAPYLETPTGGPNWQFRLQVNMLFPK